MSTLVRSQLATAIRAAFATIGVAAPAEVNLERPAKRDHGDWSTNAALATAKSAGRNPRELAASLAAALTVAPPRHVTAVEVAGPGFLNFRLSPSWLHDVIAQVLAEGSDGYGRVDVGGGRRVVVEYVSANPTGPLHAGHARWAAYGDALSRVLARSGYEVHREFYVNDRGVQMAKFALSLVARRWDLALPDGFYMGRYIKDWAAEMPTTENPLEWGLAHALAYQRTTLARMNVEFDTWSSERVIAASGAVEETLAELRARGHVYESTGDKDEFDDGADVDGGDGDGASAAKAPSPATVDPATPEPRHGMATWLRTTEAGDDKDRVLIKADGTYTYLMPDIAYHRDKFRRGDLLIDILGADHHGYVGRVKAAITFLGHDPADLEILIGQNCVLVRGGKVIKLSKRTGDLLELAEIIDEVGADAAKLTFLLQSIDTRQTVDLDLVKSQSMDNPVHYIHYAHARVYGIGRKAAEQGVVRAPLAATDLSLLVHERELDVVRVLAELPDVLTLAARERAPHKVTTWVRELAGAFQGMYHDCPVLRSDVPDDLRQARLWLVEAARIGLAVGLDLLGVSAPERMELLDPTPAEVASALLLGAARPA